VKIDLQLEDFQGNTSVKIERSMLPVILAWAATVHKMQGVTLNHAVLNLGRKNCDRNKPQHCNK